MKVDWAPYIALIGSPLVPTGHKVVIEKMVVVQEIDYFEDAIALFLGLVYIMNLRYNSKNTYEFLQCARLKLDHKISSKKAISLLAKLI